MHTRAASHHPTPASSAAAAMAAAAPTSAAVTSAATAAASGQSQVLVERGWSSIFLVEDIERRQADVGEFLLTEKEFVTL
jgi:uncharacterized protein involved in copper resistance